jgi:hypothetical protein
MQYTNGQTARYPPAWSPTAQPQQPSLRSASTQGSLIPSPFQMPTAAYIRPPPQMAGQQVPSFTAPVIGAGKVPQVPSYASPHFPQAWSGQMPIQYARPVLAVPM